MYALHRARGVLLGLTGLSLALAFGACEPAREAPAERAALEHVQEAQTPALPVMGAAPEWTNRVWINSEGPLRLADLRGRVVLLDFWTFG